MGSESVGGWGGGLQEYTPQVPQTAAGGSSLPCRSTGYRLASTQTEGRLVIKLRLPGESNSHKPSGAGHVAKPRR